MQNKNTRVVLKRVKVITRGDALKYKDVLNVKKDKPRVNFALFFLSVAASFGYNDLSVRTAHVRFTFQV